MARRCLLVVIEEIINGAGDNNFKIANDEISEIINDLYFYFKDYTINSYNKLHKLSSKESLINILTNIGKMKYSKKDH